MKTLYIARHGEPVHIGAKDAPTDFDRYLTPEGEEKLQQQARGLQKMGVTFEACYASPLVRTQQTAQFLCAPFGTTIQSADCLGSSPSMIQVQRLLAGETARHVLLVTHQPFVVQLTSWLISGRMETSFAYQPGTMACVSVYTLEPFPQGELQWFLPAEAQMRQA